MVEEWRPVKRYEGLYEVSSFGNIRGLTYGKILSPRKSKKGYCIVCLSNKSLKSFRVHRAVAEAFLMDYSEQLQVDHIDGDVSNNNLSNLRMCTGNQNSWNSSKRNGTTSKYKGVSYHKESNRWVLKIKKENKIIERKSFRNEIDAAKAYDQLALIHCGEFAKTNKMLGLL